MLPRQGQFQTKGKCGCVRVSLSYFLYRRDTRFSIAIPTTSLHWYQPMFSMAKKFLGHVVPQVIRPIHILWNQVIGFVFIVLAAVFGYRIFRGNEPVGLQIVGALFVFLIAWFGVSSFWKARKISKS